MSFCFDHYGLTLSEGDLVVPVNGQHLLLYNFIEEYIKENGVFNKAIELVVSKVYDDGNIDVTYEGEISFEDSKISNNFFACDADSKCYTKKEYFESQKKLHKYIISGGRRIIADNLVDTGYRDCYGEIIYNTSALKKVDAFDIDELYIMVEKEDGFYVVKEDYPERIIDINILNVLEIFYTKEIR